MNIRVPNFLMKKLTYNALITRADRLRFITDVQSRYFLRIVIRRQFPSEHLNEGRLSRSVFPQQDQNLPKNCFKIFHNVG